MSDDSRLADLRRRVELDPMSIAFAALAEEYRRSGRPEEAVAVCRAGLTRHPAYLSARVTLGRALLDLQHLDAAEAELRQVLALAPENLAARRAMGELQQRRAEAGIGGAPSGVPPGSAAAVIPFGSSPMPAHIPASGRSAVTPEDDSREEQPVLLSLDRFLDAIVSLKQPSI
jgi:tetratricopeptide (TPR) repeat protein